MFETVIKKFRRNYKHFFGKKYNTIKIPTLDSDYWDTDHILLHGMFTILVDFVEIEKAWMEFVFGDQKEIKKILGFRRYWLAKLFGILRSRELGLREIEDRKKTTEEECPGEAKQAQAVEELYLWWKDSYLKRQEPSKVSGWDAFIDQIEAEGREIYEFVDSGDGYSLMKSCLTAKEEKIHDKLMDKTQQIEKQYNNEETRMMKKLIDIRYCLWT